MPGPNDEQKNEEHEDEQNEDELSGSGEAFERDLDEIYRIEE